MSEPANSLVQAGGGGLKGGEKAPRKEEDANRPGSINFNIVSKGLGSNKMSYYLDEAAGELRDLLLPTIQTKAKL